MSRIAEGDPNNLLAGQPLEGINEPKGFPPATGRVCTLPYRPHLYHSMRRICSAVLLPLGFKPRKVLVESGAGGAEGFVMVPALLMV